MPDVEAGDRVMVAIVLRDGVAFDPVEFAAWIDGQDDLSAKWRPTYVRVADALPVSPTNKVLVRNLVHDKFRPDRVGDDVLWVRDRGADRFGPFGEAEADALHDELRARGRDRFWDL